MSKISDETTIMLWKTLRTIGLPSSPLLYYRDQLHKLSREDLIKVVIDNARLARMAVRIYEEEIEPK